jgi:hypothetical protein
VEPKSPESLVSIHGLKAPLVTQTPPFALLYFAPGLHVRSDWMVGRFLYPFQPDTGSVKPLSQMHEVLCKFH